MLETGAASAGAGLDDAADHGDEGLISVAHRSPTVESLDVEVTSSGGSNTYHYRRTDLEAAYGPRPTGLNRSPEDVGKDVAGTLVPLLAGGVVITGALVALVAFGASRLRNGRARA